jgi:selenide,water dikinase
VTGEVHPARVLANAGAVAGDALLLTKPIGTGVISTALKFGRAPEAAIAAAVRSMTTLNRAAAAVLEDFAGRVHACTDVTGFGLIGHGSEMAAASGCSLEIEAGAVPLIEGARALLRDNTPGGGRTNREHFSGRVRVGDGLDADLVDLLYDPQTSGGLLVAVDPSQSEALVAAFASAGVLAARIGRAVAAENARIVVV